MCKHTCICIKLQAHVCMHRIDTSALREAMCLFVEPRKHLKIVARRVCGHCLKPCFNKQLFRLSMRNHMYCTLWYYYTIHYILYKRYHCAAEGAALYSTVLYYNSL